MTMSEDAPTYEAAGQPVAEPPRQGRGPTRPAIIAADLIESVEKAGAEGALAFCIAAKRGDTAKGVTARVKERRRNLVALVKETEAAIAEEARVAEWLTDAERLPETTRGFVLAALEPIAKRVISDNVPDDGQEDPAA
jgi:hypothetical protein